MSRVDLKEHISRRIAADVMSTPHRRTLWLMSAPIRAEQMANDWRWVLDVYAFRKVMAETGGVQIHKSGERWP